MSNAGVDRLSWIGLAAGVLVVTAATYANSVDNSFHFDDEHSLTENPHIRRLGNAVSFFADPQTFSRNPGSEMYRPLVVLSYALNYRFGELKPRGYHLVNLGLHLCAVAALAVLLIGWGWQPRRAALVACLFGVHPLASEPVNYISSRSESMAAVFALTSIILYNRAQSVRERGYGLALLSFGLALMAKSSALAVLGMLPLVEAARRTERAVAPGKGGLWPRICRRQWPYWLVGITYLWGVRALVREAMEAPVRSLGSQLLTQCKGLIYYGKLLLLPYPLSVDHAFQEAESGADVVVWISALCVASVAYIVWRGIRRGDRSALFLAWSGAALMPTIAVPLNVLVNERRLYLVVAVFLGFVLWQLRQPLSRAGRPLAAATVCLFAALTVQRNTAWASERTLWEDAVTKAPASDRAHVRLGVAYRKLGRLPEARAEFERALALRPTNAPALNNLGNVRYLLGDRAGAEAAYEQALQILPSYPEPMINLAALYNGQDRHAEALRHLRRARDLAGPRPELLNNLGISHLAMGEYGEAVALFEQALRMKPGAARVYFNLAGALEGQREWERAVAAYERAIEHDTTYAKPHYNLGVLYERQGRHGPAIESYRRFLDLWHGDVAFAGEARRRLALLTGDGEKRGR